ncbi:MAG: DUF3348 family protein [Myxococcota bacterium]|nr:DUF3348 family protein [Myxococcota bacterium]
MDVAMRGRLGPMGDLLNELGHEPREIRGRRDQRNIGTMVGDLTELHGAFELALALEDLASAEWASAEFTVENANRVKALFVAQRRKLGVAIMKREEKGIRGRKLGRVPGPAHYYQHLTRVGAIAEGKLTPNKRAQFAFSPYRDCFDKRMQYLGDQLVALRDDMGFELRRLAPQFGMLEKIDSLLVAATTKATDRHLRRILNLLEARFQEGWNAAVGSSKILGLEEVTPWFDDNQWLSDFEILMFHSVRTIFSYRLQPLQALVEAVCQPSHLRKSGEESSR